VEAARRWRCGAAVRGRGAAWRGLANRIDLVVLILSVIYMNFLFSNLFFIHFEKNTAVSKFSKTNLPPP
jgi:hypothetical protein